MRSSYLTLLLIAACVSWQSTGFAQTPATPPVAANSAAAVALLDTAIAAFSRPQGVDVRFVQTILGRSQSATVTGVSITAEKQRAHIEMTYQQVGRQARLKLLCDGTTYYRLESLPDDNRLTTYTMQELQKALDSLATNEAEKVAQGDVEKEQQGIHGFAGLSAMLQDVKKRMNFSPPVARKIDLPGKPGVAVNMIEGTWTKEVLDIIAPPKQGDDPKQQDRRYLWNEQLDYLQWPRLARLYFDASSGQLYRLELVGITEKKGPQKILVNIDIQSITPLTTLDPKLFQPTEAELQYKKQTVNLVTEVRNHHQQMMKMLKDQQKDQGGK